MSDQMTIGSVRGLNRYSGKRKDPEWLNAQLQAPEARIFVLRDLKPVLDGAPGEAPELSPQTSNANGADAGVGSAETAVRWFTAADLEVAGLKTQGLSFMGIQNDRPLFALSLRDSDADPSQLNEQVIGRPETDLRSLALAGALSPNELSLVGEARALASWHQSHRCCGRCGGRNTVKDGGWRMRCYGCGQDAFPRTDPVVIMLITDGDRCLVGRETRFPEMFYSALAGFMEHGEDIEDAVRREVHEETGIEVGDVRYVMSQPWPFPYTLMIGCHGDAVTTDLKIDPDEIEDAIWISRDEARLALQGTHPDGLFMPGPFAIAHHLVKAFVETD